MAGLVGLLAGLGLGLVLSGRVIRRTAIFHALLSYLLGAVIIASTIKLLAGLAR